MSPASVLGGHAALGATLVTAALLLPAVLWLAKSARRRRGIDRQELEQRTADLRAAQDELRAMRGQLVRSEHAAIGEMAAAVAHAIRNPLANIRASAQVALLDGHQGGVSPLAPRSLATIITQVDRLDARLKELLQFAPPARRQCQPVDLNVLMRSAQEQVGGLLREGDVRIEERLSPTLPTTIGDPLLLEHVFVILLTNAIEALRAGQGRVTLATGAIPPGEKGPQVFAEIEDSGEGIRPDCLPRVFDLFYTTKPQGTGLGLAVAKKICDAHGGSITVRSQPGDGAVFRLTLPARPA